MTKSAGGGRLELQADLINPFIVALQTVLTKETGCKVARVAKPAITAGSKLPHEVNAIIGVVGDLTGLILISLPAAATLKFFETVAGEAKQEVDDLARSAIAELANTVTGTASVALEELGFALDISTPAVVQGIDAHLTTLNAPRVAVPLETDLGPITLEIALSRAKKGAVR